MRGVIIGLTLLTATACGGASFHPHVVGPGADPTLGFPDSVPPTMADTRTKTPTARQICRTEGIARGWIAVTYVRVGGECPRTEAGEYNGMVIEPYHNRPVGTYMAVCADQATPRGWVTVGVPKDHVCWGLNRHDDEHGPTSRMIHRLW